MLSISILASIWANGSDLSPFLSVLGNAGSGPKVQQRCRWAVLSHSQRSVVFFYLSYRCIPFASAEITRDVEAGSPDAPVPSSSAVKMKPGLEREARELEVTLTSRLQSLALTTSSLH